jgi:hypothetical protein
MQVEPKAFTGRDGRFEVLGLPSGSVQVAASHPDFAPAPPVQVELTDSKPIADVRIVLSRPGRSPGQP